MNKIFFQNSTLILSSLKPDKGKVVCHVEDNGFLLHANNLPLTTNSLLDKIKVLYQDDEIHLCGKKPSETLGIFQSDLMFIVAAGGVVLNPEREILLIKRKGKWDLPKGKPEKGEDLENAALREVYEECGVGGLRVISPLPATYHIYQEPDGYYVLKKSYWYHMVTDSEQTPTPQIAEQITEAKWEKLPVAREIKDQAYLSIKELILYFETNY